MINHPRLRLVDTGATPNTPSSGGKEIGNCVTGDEQDIEAMLSDPVSDLVREMDRLIARQGPLPPQAAVQATRRVARAVVEAGEARRYVVTSTHVVWLGSVLYFALTGKAPLAPRLGASSKLGAPLVSASSPHAICRELDSIVGACLASDGRSRFGSVSDFESALAVLYGADEYGADETSAGADETSVDDSQVRVRLDGHSDGDIESECPTIPPTSGVTVTHIAASTLPARRRETGTSR